MIGKIGPASSFSENTQIFSPSFFNWRSFFVFVFHRNYLLFYLSQIHEIIIKKVTVNSVFKLRLANDLNVLSFLHRVRFISEVEFIRYRFSMKILSIRDIRLLRHIIDGVTLVGFDIHRIIRQMNTTTGVIEVKFRQMKR